MMKTLMLFFRSSSVLGLMLLAWVAYAAFGAAVVYGANALAGIPGVVISVIALFLLGSGLAERHLY